MKLRFRIYEPTLDGDNNPCNSGQGASVLAYLNTGLVIKANGTEIVNTVSLSTWTNPAGTTDLGNGIVVHDMDLTGTLLTIQIDMPNVWSSVNLLFQITKTGYESYTNTITVYGYDLGNSSGSLNPAFDFYLVPDDLTADKAYSNFIAFRKPFTNEVYFYSNHSGKGSTYYLNASDAVIYSGRNGVVCSETDITIHQKQVYSEADICDTAEIEIEAIKWYPDWEILHTCTTCASDQTCIGLGDINVAHLYIDYGSLSTVYIDDVESYPYNNQRIHLSLYDKDQTFISEVFYNFQINPPPFVYDPTQYTISFNDAGIGSLYLKGCLAIVDRYSGTELTSGDLTVGKWYQITDNSGSADWTNVGAPDNNEGTQFVATDETPTDWGTGTLVLLTDSLECCQAKVIEVCNNYELLKTGCREITVNNWNFNPFVSLTLKIYELTAVDTWELVATHEILRKTTKVVTLPNDGIFKFEFYDKALVIVPGTLTFKFMQVVIEHCELRECMLTYFKELICNPKAKSKCDCGKKPCSCKDEKLYDFNALMANAITYFAKLNKEYSFNYMYDAITPEKMSELYTLKGFIDRFGEYCGNCKKNDDCGCS